MPGKESLGCHLDLKDEVHPPAQKSFQVFSSPYANLSNCGTFGTHHNSPDLTAQQPFVRTLLGYSA